jgi:hypothetical protein
VTGDVPSVRKLDGVRQQVDQDLTQSLFVGTHDHRQVVGTFEMKVQSLCFRLHSEHVNDLIEELVDN